LSANRYQRGAQPPMHRPRRRLSLHLCRLISSLLMFSALASFYRVRPGALVGLHPSPDHRQQ